MFLFCFEKNPYLYESLNLKFYDNTTQHNTTQHNTIQFNRIVSIFLVSSMLAACNIMREITPEPQNPTGEMNSRVSKQVDFQNGRLVFATSEVFMRSLSRLAQNPSSIDSLENTLPAYTSWRKYNHERWNDSSAQMLRLCEECLELPSFFSALLNSKGEYQIGETIMYVSNGKAYEIPLAQENSLKTNEKFDDNLLANIPYSIVENVRVEADDTQRNFADAKYQYQYGFGGHTFKQVFEIAGLNFSLSGGLQTSILYLRIKLEYLRNGQWQAAGEQRRMSYNNLRGFAQFGSNTFTIGYNGGLYLGQTTQNSDRSVELGRVLGFNLNVNNWTYNIQADMMNTHVPSHNQCLTTPPSNPCSGGTGLFVAPFWNKP